MIYAYPQIGTTGTYYLRGDRNNETYHRRQRFKEAGARWDGHHWIVDDATRQQLGIERMVRVSGHCACRADVTELVPEPDATVGKRVSVFCGRCDSRGSMIVESVE